MYCPKCGTQNLEDVSFCRHCGEDLGIFSQLLNKQLPASLADKINKGFRRSPTLQLQWIKNDKKRVFGELLGGLFSVLVIIWCFVLGKGSPDFVYGCFAAIAGYLIMLGILDLKKIIKANSKETEFNNNLFDSTGYRELNPADTSEFASPASITEATTNHLKMPVSRK